MKDNNIIVLIIVLAIGVITAGWALYTYTDFFKIICDFFVNGYNWLRSLFV